MQEPLKGMMEILEEQLQVMKARRCSSKTINMQRISTYQFLKWIVNVRKLNRLQDVTAEDIDAYRKHVQSVTASPHTWAAYDGAVILFLKHLETTQRIFINPARALPPLRFNFPLQPVASVNEIRKLLSTPDTTTPLGIRDRAIMETFYSTGARLDELARMTILDPDLEKGMIRITGKGDKQRVVPLGKQAVYWLKEWLRNIRPKLMKNYPSRLSLWVGMRYRRAIDHSTIEETLRTYAGLAGIKTRITPHALRRACATHMLENGAHPVQIQMLLGHSSMRNLSSYLRITIKEIRKMHRNSRPGK